MVGDSHVGEGHGRGRPWYGKVMVGECHGRGGLWTGEGHDRGGP